MGKLCKSDYNSDGDKLCPLCNLYKPISQYYWCKDARRPYSYCITCQKESTVKKQRKLKQLSIEYKGGKCINCGYNKCNAALEFHHRDPTLKDFVISGRFKNRQILTQEIIDELDKCDLLCANCHREIHSV